MRMKAIRYARKSIALACKPLFHFWGRPQQVATPRPALSLPTESHTGMSLNIMSFNIRRGTAKDGRNHWVFRSSHVNEILSRYRPDVLGLQEALDFQISEIRTMLPGYEVIGTGNLGESKGLHSAIFYDARRFVPSAEGTFWFSDTPEIPGSKGWGNIIPRTCTWARFVEKESGQSFYFYNTHLDHLSLRSRKRSVVSLIRHIHRRPFPDPFVLTGDFNARERSRPMRFLRGKSHLKIKKQGNLSNPEPLMDTFRACYPNHRNVVTYHGFRRFFFRLKLDYIFVPSSVTVQDAKIIQQRWKKCFPSDHFPLVSHIRLNPH